MGALFVWRVLFTETVVGWYRWIRVVWVCGTGQVYEQHGVQPFPFAEEGQLGAGVAGGRGSGDGVGSARSTWRVEWRCG